MKTADNKFIKDYNSNLVLNKLRENGQLSRIELAIKTELNKSTVSRIVNRLLELEYIVELQVESTQSVGRNPIMLELNRQMGKVVALEINEKEMRGAIIDIYGEIIYVKSKPVSNLDQSDFIKELFQLIHELKEQMNDTRYGLIGISVGVHGVVSNKGVVEFAPYLGWHEFNLKEILEAEFKVNIIIDNEANLTAKGDHFKLKKYKNMIDIHISERGIGVGVIIDGNIYNGFSGLSGEAGHMIIQMDGRACPCGNKGCWEQYASKVVLLNELKNKNASLENIGNQTDILNTYYNHLAAGINNLLVLFDPEVVVLNSDIFSYLDNEKIEERLVSKIYKRKKIRVSILENDACLIGGSTILVDKFFFENGE